jgi:hypothetical protein
LNRTIGFLFFFLLSLCAKGQVFTHCDSVRSLPTLAKYFTIDNLGFVYVVKADNSIEKWSASGQLINQANNKLYGKLFSIDVSNPFEIYLYYKDVNKIIFTDNQFTIRGTIDLNGVEQIQASAVARSFDNGFWAFDLSDLNLKKFTKSIKLQQQSGNVLQISNANFEPFQIIDKESKVVVYNDSTGFEMFDNFANHLKTIPLIGVVSWQFSNNKLFYINGQGIFVYDLFTLQHQLLSNISIESCKGFYLRNDQLYMLKNNQILVYRCY